MSEAGAADPQARYGTVRDWMTRAPTVVQESSPIQHAIEQMHSGAIRHLLVLDGDRLSGILSNRDLGRLARAHAPTVAMSEPVRRIMTENPVTVAPETPVATAARVLLEGRIGALPVREGDAIVGILTTSDALEALLAMVEGRGR